MAASSSSSSSSSSCSSSQTPATTDVAGVLSWLVDAGVSGPDAMHAAVALVRSGRVPNTRHFSRMQSEADVRQALPEDRHAAARARVWRKLEKQQKQRENKRKRGGGGGAGAGAGAGGGGGGGGLLEREDEEETEARVGGRRRRKRGRDVFDPVPDPPPASVEDETRLMRVTCRVNRSPVMIYWGAVVALRLGYRWAEALTLGKAVAEQFALAKGRAIGVFGSPSQRQQQHQERQQRATGDRITVDLPVLPHEQEAKAGGGQDEDKKPATEAIHCPQASTFTPSSVHFFGVSVPVVYKEKTKEVGDDDDDDDGAVAANKEGKQRGEPLPSHVSEEQAAVLRELGLDPADTPAPRPELRAVAENGNPIDSNRVYAQLKGSLGEAYMAVGTAMRMLAAVVPDELLLDRASYQLYVDFRPEVPKGKQGWGQSGMLEVSKILEPRRHFAPAAAAVVPATAATAAAAAGSIET